ncbi:MAG: hypothetical protein J1E39_08335 [Eubacterium sp.]|nr:hypothetical protein [Eubacterium sp.]
MSDEIRDKIEETSEQAEEQTDWKPLTQKELLQRRKEEEAVRQQRHIMTDVEEKEEAVRRLAEEEELEKQLAPFVSARKFCIWACGFMWLFAVFCLLTGTLEMRLFLPMCLLVLCATAAINIPIFAKKKKYKDAVISLIAAIACAAVGIVIFVLS